MHIKFHSLVFALTETFICIVLCEENCQGEKKKSVRVSREGRKGFYRSSQTRDIH